MAFKNKDIERSYRKQYYLKNKKRTLTEQKQYYLNNKEGIIERVRQYGIKNRVKVLASKKRYYKENIDKVKQYNFKNRERIKTRRKIYSKQYRLNNYESIIKKQQKKWYDNNQTKIIDRQRQLYLKYKTDPKYKKRVSEYAQRYNQIPKNRELIKRRLQQPEVKERRNRLARIWNRNNPRSNTKYSYDLQDAMNAVRVRDNNTCQWQGCGLTHKEISIHVHHIFQRNKYPELELVEQYMICYCASHHAQWHKYKGDHYANLIDARVRLKIEA